MEYSFKINGERQSLKLDEYSMVWQKANNQLKINYAEVESVRLKRPRYVDGKYLFSCSIKVTDKPMIKIFSYSVEEEKTLNHFNHYNQFVRVLHFHLKNKSKASFRYGMSYISVISYTFIALLVLIGSYPLSVILRDHMVAVFIVVPVVIAFALLKIMLDKPGSYQPDGIPYHILPGSSNM